MVLYSMCVMYYPYNLIKNLSRRYEDKNPFNADKYINGDAGMGC